MCVCVCTGERAIEKQRMRNNMCVREIVSGMERHIQTYRQTVRHRQKRMCVCVGDRKKSV